jgi:asparagine synthase (glutamine-hydrolysing)
MGFGVPMGSWIREPLREWVQDLLSEAALKRHGFLHPRPLQEMLRRHLAGADEQAALWHALVFQAWVGAGRTA